MSKKTPPVASFRDLNLPDALHKALESVGYETPSPIQAQTIPLLLKGQDVLGNAPTGTGKTAAFALPLLARINLRKAQVQVMVLTPTRELTIQVAEAFQRYATHLEGFHVLPIYGGQDYGGQIRQLNRGVQVVVGTPGRVMDHMRKGTLRLDKLQALVLDEADEMLRMGFIDDVEWILEQLPIPRQTALFSATMPREVQRIARRHLNDPAEVTIESKTATAETISQRYWLVSGLHKLDALTRILEVEDFDGMLIFVRTRIATTELAERLEARGYAAAALNGDMVQKHREQMVEKLKSGSLDILVATDVAARGLDVERVSHVVNYDIPYDTEAYIHRIGRTGRAGRAGDAILFVSPRERRMLGAIERATRQKIEPLVLPSTEMVNNKRVSNFKQSITDTLAAGELQFMKNLLEQYQHDHDVPPIDIAAALAKQVIGERPLLLQAERERPATARHDRDRDTRQDRPDRGRRDTRDTERPPRKSKADFDANSERFRIDVGLNHGVKAGNIVGAIANEAGLDSQYIGRIELFDDHSLVDLPVGMPDNIFHELKKAWVCGQRLNISRLNAAPPKAGKPPKNKAKERDNGKGKPKRKDKAGDKPKNKPKRNAKPKRKAPL